jgi:hypothetical protein
MKLHNLVLLEQFLRNRTFLQKIAPQGSKIVRLQYVKKLLEKNWHYLCEAYLFVHMDISTISNKHWITCYLRYTWFMEELKA